MNNLRDFAAIDFETANFERCSVCSVGIAIVKDLKITDTFYSLIKPNPEYYLWRFSEIHGLTLNDTSNAPIFPEVWAEVSRKIEELPLVAHNAAFDESCLIAAHKSYSMEYPNYNFYCTCRECRKYFRNLPQNLRPKGFSLDCVSSFLDIELKHHHNALDDAIACAEIAIAI